MEANSAPLATTPTHVEGIPVGRYFAEKIWNSRDLCHGELVVHNRKSPQSTCVCHFLQNGLKAFLRIGNYKTGLFDLPGDVGIDRAVI